MNDATDYPTQGLFGRLLRRPFLKGLQYELSKLIPDVDAASIINKSQIDGLLQAFGVEEIHGGTGTAILMDLMMLASEATSQQIKDRQTDSLPNIAKWLGLDTLQVEVAVNKRAEQFFQIAYEQMIGAGPVTDASRDQVLAYGKSLSLSHERLVGIANGITGPIIKDRLASILADTMLSPDEEATLYKLATDLGVRLDIGDAETTRVMDLARTRWRISQGILPLADSPLMLKRGETCHAAVAASAYEERTRSVRTGYSGISTRIKIVKGVYYNAGSYKAGSTKEAYSFPLGSGHLVVTDKRVIFSSPQKNMAFALDSIVDWTLYADGIEIRRATGKPIVYVFGTGNGLFLEVIIAARKKFVG
jgi:hypothetical protein